MESKIYGLAVTGDRNGVIAGDEGGGVVGPITRGIGGGRVSSRFDGDIDSAAGNGGTDQGWILTSVPPFCTRVAASGR